MIVSEFARELLSLARHGGGGTVPLNGLPLPTTGYFVGGRVPPLILSEAEVDRRATIYRLINFAHRVDTPYVGVWVDSETGRIHFDAVEWYQDQSAACAVGRVRGELAVWDIDQGRELRLA